MVRMHVVRRAAVAVSCLALLVAGCGDDDSTSSDGTSSSTGITGTVTVLAASSLTGALSDIAEAFESAHPGVDVALTFDASSALAAQVLEGVPADVFVSADTANLAKVIDAGLAADPVDVATNELQIVVPAGNPADIRELADLAADDFRLALCAPEVPCGRYATEAFAKAGLPVPSASQEENVKGVLTKVTLGEADAGLVYVTDVLAADGAEGVDLPVQHQVPATYPAAVVADGPNPGGAAAFLAFLTGEGAQAILREAGFGPP